jgi:ketosteroid isomerase-like protein
MTHRPLLVSACFASIVVAAACGSPSPAPATATPATKGSSAVPSTQEVLDHHSQTFGAHDIEGVLADYAPDAVMFTPAGPVKGTDALRNTFKGLFEEWSKPGFTFEMKQQTVDGDYAYLYWNAETADNTYEGAMDGFVVKDGKIVAHFFGGKITPKATKK